MKRSEPPEPAPQAALPAGDDAPEKEDAPEQETPPEDPIENEIENPTNEVPLA